MNLFETVSGLAVRRLKHEHVLALREGYFSVRAKLHPLMTALYGTFDAAELRDHLKERIGTNYEILMVHSSVNHMKPMFTSSPLDLVRMLIGFCGADRTLVMPAFYFGDPAIGGVHETFKRTGRFDVRRVPSQMGLATELFRRTAGVSVSRHPVYRVAALGPLAEQLTRGHERAGTPCGRGTPFHFMANHDTRIIGIGKTFEVLTQVHHSEDLMQDRFPVPARAGVPLSMTLVDGPEEIPFELASRGLEWSRKMWKLRRIMNRETLREWRFHHVPLFSTRADAVSDALMRAAERGVTLYERP
jgi:aminoglycoside 3-N-acetyltransferase